MLVFISPFSLHALSLSLLSLSLSLDISRVASILRVIVDTSVQN